MSSEYGYPSYEIGFGETRTDGSLRSDQILAIFFFILLLVVTGLRLHASIRLRQSGLSLNDGLFCVSSIFAIMGCLHSLTYTTLQNATAFDYLSARVFPESCFVFLSLSLLSLYHTLLFPTSTCLFRLTFYLLLLIIFLLYLSLLSITLSWCTPLSRIYTPNISGTCLPALPVYRFFSIHRGLRLGVDIAICSIPIKHFWRLEMRRRKRVQLVGLFGMGALNCIVSVVLLRMQVKFVMGGMDVEATPLVLRDVLWIVEYGSACILASLPSLRIYFPVFASLFRGGSPYHRRIPLKRMGLSNNTGVTTQIISTSSSTKSGETGAYGKDRKNEKGLGFNEPRQIAVEVEIVMTRDLARVV